MGTRASGTVLGALLLCAGGPALGEEKRDRAWLVGTLTRTPADTPRTRRYLQIIDQANLRGLLDATWLENGEGSGKGRMQATLLGQMAFAYHAKGTRWHRDRALLDEIRVGFRGFAKHQDAEGRFVWPKPDTYEGQAHEHVWRLEPLLLAYVWIQADLPAEERKAWLEVLRKGGEYLIAKPFTEPNNRGAVWCAGTRLCALYFEDARYLRLLERHAPAIMESLVTPRGEVVETQGGGGPDSNYSYVGWSYAFLYRLLAGADSMDARLQQGLRWLVHYTDFSGALMCTGSSTRKADEVQNLSGLLPALERYSQKDPFLARVADLALERMGNAGYGLGSSTVHPLVWALLEGRAGKSPPETPPWYRGHSEVYEWPKVHYLLVGRAGY